MMTRCFAVALVAATAGLLSGNVSAKAASVSDAAIGASHQERSPRVVHPVRHIVATHPVARSDHRVAWHHVVRSHHPVAPHHIVRPHHWAAAHPAQWAHHVAISHPVARPHAGKVAWIGEKGVASYYARRYQGRRTSSGQRFNEHAMTAAHPWLPFGTKVRVELPGTDRSVVVTITDRMYSTHRVIDLSRAAARKLGILHRGVAEVILQPT